MQAFGDSFDLYTSFNDMLGYWDTGTGPTSLGLTSSGRFSGSQAISSNGQTNNPHIFKTSGSNDAVHHFVFSSQIIQPISGTNVYMYVVLHDGSTAQCTFGFLSNGNMVLWSGLAGGTSLATYASAIATQNTWYAFEVEIVINNTTGSFTVRRNGNTSNDFQATSLNTRGGTSNNYANRIGIGNWTNGNVQSIDDFLWRSDPSSVPWIGDVCCYTRAPVRDVTVQFSRSPASATWYSYTGTGQNGGPAANTIWWISAQAAYGGTITALNANFGAGVTGHVNMALYDATGASIGNPSASSGPVPNNGPGPGNLLSICTPVTNPASGFQAFTLTTPVAATRGQYFWIGMTADASLASAVNSGGAFSAAALAYTYAAGAFPATAAGYAMTGSHTGFAYLGATVTLNNSAAVSDPHQDGANSYVFDSNAGDSDLYGITSIAGLPLSVVAVTTRGYLQKSGVGTRNAAIQIKSGATTVNSGSAALNTAWNWAWRTDLTDPNTGSAWTAPAVNNAQIGQIVTL